MKADVSSVPVRGYLPSSLYRHPAWIEWKATQGWRRIGTVDACPILEHDLGASSAMAYAVAPPLCRDAADGDYGARLEELSERALPLLSPGCAFLRWDPVDALWSDVQGAGLERRLLELRMNASTRKRRFRKAATEHIWPETMVVDLRGGWSAVLSRMEHRARYSAKLAERRGTVVEKAGEAGLGDFYGLFRRTAALRGIRLHSESCYRELFRAARNAGLSLELYRASVSGEPAAAAIIARHRREAWYLFAASDPAHRRSAGPSAILHRALRDCAEAGDECIDLLGVAPADMPNHPLSGLSLFKASFGGKRRSRTGAWDYVLDTEVYAEYSQVESMM